MTLTENPTDITVVTQRPQVVGAAIGGYGANPQQEQGAAPHPEAGGDIEQVAESRNPRSERTACDLCGKLIIKKNIWQHKRVVHGVYKRGKPPKGKQVDSEAQPPKQARTPKIKVTAEEVVLITVQMRWPNGVPVDKVPGLMAWARHTERFFNE